MWNDIHQFLLSLPSYPLFFVAVLKFICEHIIQMSISHA